MEGLVKNVILIDEEYGYQNWILVVDDAGLEELKSRWASMHGINCLVPIPLVFPHAERCTVDDWLEWADTEMTPERRGEVEREARVFRAHVHECDDSSFDALPGHKVPPGEVFVINGVPYGDDDLYALGRSLRAHPDQASEGEPEEDS